MKHDRPFVVLNMASTVDGKTSTVNRIKLRFGSSEDRYRMERLRASAHAIMIGSGTLRIDDPPLLVRSKTLQSERRAEGKILQPINVAIVTRASRELLSSAFIREVSTRKIVYCTEVTERIERALHRFNTSVVSIPVGEDGRVDLRTVLLDLKKSGVDILLLEGGGTLNFSMLRADLVDEVYLTVTPFLFGGAESPTILDGEGFRKEDIKRLRLRSCEQGAKGEVFLRYETTDDRVHVRPSAVFAKGFEVDDSL